MTAAAPISAQQVSWWSVYAWAQKYLDHVGSYPWPGTPAWCLLPDDSREKWAAILDFAQHHALRVEVAQQAQADAGTAISQATNWSAVARSNLRHANAVASGAYIPARRPA